jgi:integrase
VQGFLRVYDDFYVLFYHVFAFKPRVGAGLAIVQQGLNTGLRESEVIGLTWDCIDFDRALIRVYRQFQRVAKEFLWQPLKNNKPRVIPAPSSLLDILKEQRRRQGEMKLKAGSLWSNPDNLVFTNETGRYLNYATIRNHFKRIVISLGSPQTRFHDLRHQYAITSLQAGIDIKTVQESLGHHTAAFTLDTYAHVTDGMRKDAAAKLDIAYKSLISGKRTRLIP